MTKQQASNHKQITKTKGTNDPNKSNRLFGTFRLGDLSLFGA
jgi:hypothetical protein